MALPSITGIARLTGDPELRFSPSGMAIAVAQLAFNSRRQNKQTQEWEDADTFFVKATAFKDLAEHMAESLTRGTEVVITGRLKTAQWESKEGEKRSAPELLIDSIGPSLRYATAKVSKAQRSGADAPAGQSADPWSAAPATAGAPAGGYEDEPPF